MLSCCGGSGTTPSGAPKDANYDSVLVINELMPQNRTGLQDSTGEPSDWVELKNITPDSVSLEGLEIRVQKVGSSKDSKFPLPAIKLDSGACRVVFVKLPKEGACVQLLSPSGDVMSEVEYEPLSPDESYCRRPDGTFENTRWQSPGYENDADGYEAYCQLVDEHRGSPLLIWEVMSRAEKKSGNWVELRNVSDSTIDLSGYALTTKLPDKKSKVDSLKFKVQSLSPHQSLVVPFRLGDAETVVLTRNGKFVDGVCAKLTYIGTSVGRVGGRRGFFYFATPTRDAENGTAYRFIADEPRLVGRAKKDTVVVSLTPSRAVHYTLDGSEPTASSPLLRDSLVLTKTTVVRAYAEGDANALRSDVATSTWFVNEHHTMPVISIAINDGDLYDFNRGIYAKGPGYSPEWPHHGANFWKPWTRKAHVEMFDGKKEKNPQSKNNGQRSMVNGQWSMVNGQCFSSDCGLKIFGGFSRYEAKKSFTVKFKNCYGNSSLTYDFFGTGEPVKLKDVVLRSGSQDWNRCMVRDEFFTSLMAPQCPTLLIQSYRPVALYINGGYFGLYYIREKIDKHFVSRKLGVSTDSITIIMSRGYQEEGTNQEYNRLMAYITSHDMTQGECYDYVRERVDLQGLIDYKLGEIYSGNTDVGNIRYVRSADKGCDGKWYFVFYDLDATWVGYKPTAAFYLRCDGEASQSGVGVHNRMIWSLLRNKNFRRLFMERLSHHMHHTFSSRNATAVFDGIVRTIRPEMKRNCERWPQLSYAQWEKNIKDFRAHFADKHKVMLNDLRQLLQITPAEEKRYFSDLGF